MMKALAIAAFMLLVSATHTAGATDVVLHSEPAADDNLRVYAFVEGSATFLLDGGAPLTLPGMSIGFTRLEPGSHQASVILPDGSQASLALNLSAPDLAESRGHQWWCLIAMRRDGQLTIFQPTAAQCKKIADSGPN